MSILTDWSNATRPFALLKEFNRKQNNVLIMLSTFALLKQNNVLIYHKFHNEFQVDQNHPLSFRRQRRWVPI
jgi:hypothetical protein